MREILRGVRRFQNEIFPERKNFFRELARKQRPQAMLITCSDSRIDPALITQISPGTVFIVRNAGNMVVPHDADLPDIAGSIEYAVSVLNVRHIIVCGHTHCGAMEGLFNPDALVGLPHVGKWLTHASPVRAAMASRLALPRAELLSEAARVNVKLQLDNLRTYPMVAAREAAKEVYLHGWVYDIEHGEMYIHQPGSGAYEPLSELDLDAGSDETPLVRGKRGPAKTGQEAPA